MRVGISTASLFMRRYNEDTLPLFAEWKIPVAEVFLSSFTEYDPAFARILKERKGDVEVYSVHTINTQYEPQLYSASERVRGDAFRILGQAMESARILGASAHTFHGIARLKRTYREDIPHVAEQTLVISEYCKKFGVRLCYENVEWAFYNRPGIFRELKAACPDLGGVLDIKQARISGYDYRDYLAEMGPSLSHVHVSDFAGKGCLPGKGAFDFCELFARLRDAGFDGPVLIENYAGDYQELGELRASYEWLSELAEKYR